MKGYTHRIAQATLLMAVAVNGIFGAAASELVKTRLSDKITMSRGDRITLWEVACAPNSSLAAHGEKLGHDVLQKNLANGYDLSRKQVVQQLIADAKLEKPRRIWISLPCTVWSQFTRLNYYTPEGKMTLELRRRRARRMIRNIKDALSEILVDVPDTEMCWEWPTTCDGWPELKALEKVLEKHGRKFKANRVDGCRFDMRNCFDL